VFSPSNKKECDLVKYNLMGCCGKINKTIKNKSDVTKTEKKKNLINNVSY
jgi:hypothetical protein